MRAGSNPELDEQRALPLTQRDDRVEMSQAPRLKPVHLAQDPGATRAQRPVGKMDCRDRRDVAVLREARNRAVEQREAH